MKQGSGVRLRHLIGWKQRPTYLQQEDGKEHPHQADHHLEHDHSPSACPLELVYILLLVILFGSIRLPFSMLPSHRSDTSVEQLPPEPYRDDDEDEAESPLLDHRGNDHLSMLGVEEGPDNPPPPPSWMPQYDLRSRIPPGVIRSWEATKKWTKGPQPPRPWSITPIAEKYQTLPIQLRDRYLPKKKHKIVALILYYFLWLLTFSLMVQKSSTVAYVPGYGAPNSIGCSSRMWYVIDGFASASKEDGS